jgi:Fe-S cluster assembly protein SufD
MSQIVNSDINSELDALYGQFERKLNADASQPLQQLRLNAMASFRTQGLPAAKHEEYKYTPISKRLQKGFDVSQLAVVSAVNADELKSHLFQIAQANHLVFVNGQFRQDVSSIISPESQIIIKPLSVAMNEHAEEVVTAFKKFENKEKDAFQYLNTAFIQEGLFIKIGKSKAVEAPIIVYNFLDGRSGQAFAQPRNLILAEANSQATILEWKQSLGTHTTFANTLSQIVLQQDAIVDFYKLQNDHEDSLLVSGTQAIHEGKSVFNSVTISLKGGMIRNNLEVTQNASHCETNMFGLYLLDGKTHVDNHTSVDHTQPNSESNELYKGIMDGSSTAVFNGKIFVRQAAQKTNAFQSNRNVLLSDSATVNTKPQLEIWADDVKCSHGCTVGQLDEEQLFYLRARGLSKASARAMLLIAFAEDVLDHIKIDEVHAHLTQLITERLEK